HLKALVEGRRDVRKDCPRSESREHLERLPPRFLGPAQPEEEIGAPHADVDQLALEVVAEILEIRGAGIQMKAQPCQRSLRDANVDVARGRGSLRGSHGAIIAAR